MQTNVFLGGPDPLLRDPVANVIDYDRQISELKQMQQQLELQHQKRMQSNGMQVKNLSPLCDEIDRLTDSLTAREFSIINDNPEFQKSQERISGIMNREYLKIMRPIVESCPDGKEALESHLNLLKSLKKEASSAVERNMELFNEYTEKYADMTYADFLKMKRSNN